MEKVYLIIRTSIREFDVDTNVEVYGDETKAKQAFEETKEEIKSLAEEEFNEVGDYDSDDWDGAREESETYFGIHQSWSASDWEECVSIVEKQIL